MAIPAKKAEPTLLAEARHMVQVFAKASKIALAQIYYLIFCIYNKTQQIIVKYSETYLKNCVYSSKNPNRIDIIIYRPSASPFKNLEDTSTTRLETRESQIMVIITLNVSI